MNSIKEHLKRTFLYTSIRRLRGLPVLREEFSHMVFSPFALQKLLDDYQFDSVLDVGCGSGEHSEIFSRYNKSVTAIDFGHSPYFRNNKSTIATIIGDFNSHNFNARFDCIWCSHILEHQLNINTFLKKVFLLLNENGVLSITVPPLKHQIVGGHVSLWNAGLLLYSLVLAGFDCRSASILTYRYNISVIVKKKEASLPADLSFDNGDIRKIKSFLPDGIEYVLGTNDDWFDGRIRKLNW
jgi:SAM-dependent methyltransferase